MKCVIGADEYPYRHDTRDKLPLPDGELWVFAYGSLMWKPGFPHVEAYTARLHGYHRALCVWSHHYRGTRDCPGLVLGLDRGGCCVGRVYRVADVDREETVDYLERRELTGGIYAPLYKAVRIPDGRRVHALAFIVRRDHEQYAGRLDAARATEVVRRSCGERGLNVDYVINTVVHLEELGIRDPLLHKIFESLRRG